MTGFPWRDSRSAVVIEAEAAIYQAPEAMNNNPAI